MNDKKSILKIGSRGSKLALLQANEVKIMLLDHLGWENQQVEIIRIKTLGDRIKDRPFRELEGKGVFCKEIEQELLEGSIDIGVHSLKDMPFEQPEGLSMVGFLQRENPLDVLICQNYEDIEVMPAGQTIGTSSIRRQKQIMRANPAISVVEIRGNIDSRIRKWETGEVDGIVLAAAGLNRMGIWQVPRHEIPMATCLPAPAQGIIGLEARTRDYWLKSVLKDLTHPPTKIMATTERNFMHTLEGSCELPVGALVKLHGSKITLHGEFYSEKRGELIRGVQTALLGCHSNLGQELAESLLARE